MKKNIILSNFQPIVLSKQINQEQISEYMKFLFHRSQKKKELAIAGDDEAVDSGYDEVSNHVDKYAVAKEHINKRQILIFDSLAEFIENKMSQTSPTQYPLPDVFETESGNIYGPKIGSRMNWYKEKTRKVFDRFYANNQATPENVVHVTCSGYTSPSVAQEAVIKNSWTETQVTHSYQMGCYGAFPAIRTAAGLLSASDKNGRVDIIHTELLSAHLNLTELSPSNTMICSLFADGFIGYSLYEEDAFRNDNAITEMKGLKIIASHEVIIPDSLEDMSWDLGEYNFLMTLSKRVPVFIRKNIKSFLTTLCQKGGVNIEEEKYKMHFAIHPGGPKIIDYIVDEMELFKEQARWSYEVLRLNGNMSSATIPHILNEIINDNAIKPGTKIATMAFGPGLTATALLLEKI